jgi:hypothetical protein
MERRYSMKIETSPQPTAPGFIEKMDISSHDIESLSVEKGALKCTGFKIHLEET